MDDFHIDCHIKKNCICTKVAAFEKQTFVLVVAHDDFLM